MIGGLKLLLDENIGRPITESIASILWWHESRPVVKHLLDIEQSGIRDSQWLKRLASEGWVVMTADRAKRCGGDKLPQICLQFGITHILIGGTLHNQKQFEKARAIIYLWPEILRTFKAKKGSRYSLRYNTQHKPILKPVVLQ
jgi:hypothetical protein